MTGLTKKAVRADRVICGIGICYKMKRNTENDQRKGGKEDVDRDRKGASVGDLRKEDFEIIAEELGDKQLIPGTESIVKRCIHTSADFDYADNLNFFGKM